MNPNGIFPRYFTNPNNLMRGIYPNANLFSRIKTSLGAIKWKQLFNGANQTINFVNQTVPLIQKTKPMIDNLRSIMKISKELNTIPNIENKSKEKKVSQLSKEVVQKKEVDYNKPNFFI